jgi:hypothetical protein
VIVVPLACCVVACCESRISIDLIQTVFLVVEHEHNWRAILDLCSSRRDQTTYGL